MTDNKAIMRECRIKKNISLERLRDLTGLTISTLSRIELGIHSPQPYTRERIEAVLGKVDWQKTYEIGRIRNTGNKKSKIDLEFNHV